MATCDLLAPILDDLLERLGDFAASDSLEGLRLSIVRIRNRIVSTADEPVGEGSDRALLHALQMELESVGVPTREYMRSLLRIATNDLRRLRAVYESGDFDRTAASELLPWLTKTSRDFEHLMSQLDSGRKSDDVERE